MPTWLVLTLVVAAAVAGFAVIWWSSGRARTGSGSLDARSAEERYQLDVNRTATMRNRDGMGPLR